MLFGKKCKYCGKEYSSFNNIHCPYCDDIDFSNIDSVTVTNTEMTYRTETEEEFDPVMTNFLTDMDGWQHYETKTVEFVKLYLFNCYTFIKFFDITQMCVIFCLDYEISCVVIWLCDSAIN